LARYQAGPRGGMILSDLGAEVIKVEKIGGEETRRSEPVVRGQSVYFSVYNRGKKSLCLDMRTERGKEVFAALVPTADIVLQNFRPGVMEKMGFGYDRLCQLTSSWSRSRASANTALIANAPPSTRSGRQ
jgi:crotonobetainyl-CoA:carnitine CoA-transferase CaiB-like acyl-CoA transferase